MKPKEFDCVEMKNEIQQRLREEYQGLSDEEIRLRRRSKLQTSDSELARKFRRLQRAAVSR